MVHLAREPVRRKPFGHRIRVDERPIDLLGRRTQHAVKPGGVCRHYRLLSLGRSSSFNGDLGIIALLPNAQLSSRRRTVWRQELAAQTPAGASGSVSAL